MLTHLLIRLRRRRTPRNATGRVDERHGAPIRRRSDPLPRIRYY